MKVDQISLRMPAEMRKALEENAMASNQKLSEYIRSILKKSLQEKEQSSLEKRIENIENLYNRDIFSSVHVIIVKAISQIIAMDTAKPIEQILPDVYDLLSSEGSLKSIDLIPRKEREEIDLKLLESLKSKFKLSQLAVAFASSFVVAFLGLTYNEDLFQPYPFSMDCMQNIASLLRK